MVTGSPVHFFSLPDPIRHVPAFSMVPTDRQHALSSYDKDGRELKRFLRPGGAREVYFACALLCSEMDWNIRVENRAMYLF